MRDDLSDLFQKLVSQYNEKLSLLGKISTNEIQLRYLLQSDNISDLYNMIQAETDFFAMLDSLEFDIQTIIRRICRISGVKRNNFKNFFLNKNDEPIPYLNSVITDVEKRLSELMKDRDKLITDMEQRLKDMKKDIDTINIIRKLKRE